MAARPYAARINLDGSPFFPSDLRLVWSSVLVVGVGGPALSAVAALVSLRAEPLSPLGVTRKAVSKPPAWWRIVPLGLGAAGFVTTLPMLASGSAPSRCCDSPGCAPGTCPGS